jgi:hypothetical protein
MKTENTNKKEYSREIRDILEKEPAWIIRNGMWIIMVVLTLVIVAFLSITKFLSR